MTSLAQELQRMRALKDTAETVGREKKEADARFKAQQRTCLGYMEAEEADSFRTKGYLYSAVTDRVKGRVEDRRAYVRWALENDESIQEFLDWLLNDGGWEGGHDVIEERFYDAITSTSVVSYRESQNVLNQQARTHLDDGQPLPPGMTYDPDPAIQMRKS